MFSYLIKLLLSASIIVAVSAVSKRSTFIGGLLASLPLVSFLSLLWLYHDTHDTEKVAALSISIFWLVLPSLVFFVALPTLLRARQGFYVSFAAATGAMLASYGVMVAVFRRMNVSL
jgi:hypothetical protein